MLKFDHVSRSYGSRLAVDDLDLELRRGQLFALLGHNGAGKTTTIKMLVGLLRPSRGTITVGHYDAAANPREVSRLVGYVPDQPFLYDKLSGREFLRFVADMYGLSHAAADAAVKREIERFALGEFAGRLTESYSHGMRQRTVFAAAMIHEPEVLVVDEPMVGLDPQSIKLVKDLLQDYAHSGRTVLMSTHTLDVAERIADRVGVMKSGKLVFDGSVPELQQAVQGTNGTLEAMYLALMDG